MTTTDRLSMTPTDHYITSDQMSVVTCLTSSGVFCGGTEAAFLFSPLVTTSYSFPTRLAFMYSRLRSSCIFLAMIGLIDCSHSNRPNNHTLVAQLRTSIQHITNSRQQVTVTIVATFNALTPLAKTHLKGHLVCLKILLTFC